MKLILRKKSKLLYFFTLFISLFPLFFSFSAPPKMLLPEMMKEDLSLYLEKLQNIHPLTIDGFTPAQKELIEDTYMRIDRPMSKEKFFLLINRIPLTFSDAHTAIHYFIRDTDYVDLSFHYLDEGLIVNKETDLLNVGDKILFIHDVSPSDLLQAMKMMVPAENDQWRKFQLERKLKTGYLLRYFGLLEKDTLPLTVERKGEIILCSLPLKKITKEVLKEYYAREENWIDWEIDEEHSLGVFRLDQCPGYKTKDYSYCKKELKRFFSAIKKKEIKNVVIDLRNNFGGSSCVVDEWLRYLPVKTYNDITATVRYSLDAGYEEESFEFERDWFENVKKVKKPHHNRFKGNLFILTSRKTFSSAVYMATILKDNGLAKTVGEPTGGMPTTYGDIISLTLPNCRCYFTISHKKFYRPDIKKDAIPYLDVDLYIPTTREDLIEGRDGQVEGLKKYLKSIDS